MMPITSVVNLDDHRAPNKTGPRDARRSPIAGRAIFKPPGYIFVSNIPLR
jgi:hypothetical protein